MEMVTIIVNGRPVQVPGHTSASEIRRTARCGPGCPLARTQEGRSKVVSGELDVSEGDHFIAGRSFAKGMQKFKVLSSKKQRKADKSVRVLFPVHVYERMRSAFADSEAESREGYAIAQCGCKVDGSRKNWTYMVRTLHIPAKDEILEQSSITVTPKAEFIEAILAEATEKNNSILEIHTHVGSREPNFSWIDIENGLENGRFLRACGLRFAMAVIGSDGFSISEYDGDHDALQTPESARISVVNRAGIKDALAHRSSSSCELPAANGPACMRVSVIGLNGIGFGIVYMLAGMGVKKFTLLDDGMIEENNPEVMPYTSESGKKRTKAAQNMLKKISRDIEVAHVNDVGNAVNLKETDFIFACDERASAISNEASLKYFIPCIEARTLAKKDTAGQYGRIRVLIPSVTGCMGCCGEETFVASGEDGASRVAINSVVASMAVREFMDIVSGEEALAKSYDQVEYDPATQAMERKAVARNETCALCGKNGLLGAGDERRPIGKTTKTKIKRHD